MLEGNIIKAFILQSDGKFKPRPSVVIKKLPYYDDWLICGISSKIHIVYSDLDILIKQSHPDFKEAGLKFESVIRTGWLSAFPESKIEGILGRISETTLKKLQQNLSNFVLK